jgi:hypothetical protein
MTSALLSLLAVGLGLVGVGLGLSRPSVLASAAAPLGWLLVLAGLARLFLPGFFS